MKIQLGGGLLFQLDRWRDLRVMVAPILPRNFWNAWADCISVYHSKVDHGFVASSHR